MIYALHGAVGMAADWKPFADAMQSQGRRVARVDLWQYLACCPMSRPAFGAAINKEVHHQDSVLLGYSMGGRLALHALLDNPHKWRKAVIISAHLGLDAQQRSTRRAQDAEWATKALRDNWDQFLQEWNAQSVLAGVSMPNRQKLQSQREAVARSFIDWSLGAQENLLDSLPIIHCPVLWMVGEKDTKFLEQAQIASQYLPNIQTVVVPDCGHRIPWEQPNVFYEHINAFLKNES